MRALPYSFETLHANAGKTSMRPYPTLSSLFLVLLTLPANAVIVAGSPVFDCAKSAQKSTQDVRQRAANAWLAANMIGQTLGYEAQDPSMDFAS